jgi:galactokinase/mevalonate kinase-like predicted kinase
LDFIPLSSEELAIRNYGFIDSFRGEWSKSSTVLMNQPLVNWLNKRNLTDVFQDVNPSTDIFELPLFVVLQKNELKEEFIQWLIDKNPKENKTFTELWKNSKRLNCAQLSNLCDINQAEEQRSTLRRSNFIGVAANHQHSVFYQLDLKKTANDFVLENLDLPPEINSNFKDWLPIHDFMFRSHYHRLKNGSWDQAEKEAFSYLQSQIVDLYKRKLVEPNINLLPDQIAWGRSPVRLDLAGGWTDTPPYCFLYGGTVTNVAVELNGQPPLHCYIKGNTNNEIVLRSIDLGAREEIRTFEDIRSFENIQSAFSIPKAALALTGFLPEFATKKYHSLEEQLKAIGGGLEITILSAVPKGSGLGTSSILAATVLGTLAEVCCLNWDKLEIGERTLALEQLLTTGGGWQDQFGGLFEGIKMLETQSGKQQEPLIKWLPESIISNPENKNRILLYYTGITRVAKNILGEIVRGMFLNSKEHLAILEELKTHATNTYNTLLQKDFNNFAKMIDKSWQLNQELDSGTNTPEIQQLINKVEPHILGQKLLGAGGGGFMLMLAKNEEAAMLIKKELTANPINPRGRFVNFEVSKTGFQVTKS